jgi:hypothetical protein
MPPDRYLLLDTNVLLHFPPLSDVDWLSMCNAKSATILIVPVVIRELNKHKDAPRSGRLRDKAVAVLKDLHARFKGDKPKKLRSAVEISFVVQDANLDFGAYGLARDLNDDWLIASAIQAKTEYAPTKVSLVTADLGLEVKGSVHLDVIQMPETLRIPEELDSNEKQMLELQRRLSTIESASPALQVTFANKKSFSQIELFQFEPWSEERKKEELERAHAEHPPMPLKAPPSGAPFDFAFLSNKDIRDYNGELAGYYQQLAVYHEQLNNIAAWYNRTAKIKLLLRNAGGAPAEDIDVLVHFPDAIEVLEEPIQLPNEPKPPAPIRESILSMLDPKNLDILALGKFPMPRVLENARLLGIKKNKGYDVEFHVQRLKHQNEEELPSFYLHFPKKPISFRAEVRLVAANVPEAITGTLDFIYRAEASEFPAPA